MLFLIMAVSWREVKFATPCHSGSGKTRCCENAGVPNKASLIA
jgi:hypothetical protein